MKDPLTGRKGAIVHNAGALAKRDLNNFQPRVGVAYNFRPKWVFRGNFGMITADLLTSTLNNNFEEYLATASLQAPPGDPRTIFALSQGPPSFKFNLNQDGSVPFIGTNYSGRNATWFDPNMRMPYTLNWSSGFQYQISNSWLAEVLYQGSSGVGLLNNWDINVVPLNISTDRAQLTTIRNSYQNFKPYPQFGSIQHYSNYGHNSHHGVTVRVDKRYSSGFTVNSFWTWSKTLNDVDDDGGAGGITWYNRSLEKGRASYDISHRWVSTITYELPVGRGKKVYEFRTCQERRLRWLGADVRPDVPDRTSVHGDVRRKPQSVPAGQQPPHPDRPERSGQAGARRHRSQPVSLSRPKTAISISTGSATRTVLQSGPWAATRWKRPGLSGDRLRSRRSGRSMNG